MDQNSSGDSRRTLIRSHRGFPSIHGQSPFEQLPLTTPNYSDGVMNVEVMQHYGSDMMHRKACVTLEGSKYIPFGYGHDLGPEKVYRISAFWMVKIIIIIRIVCVHQS